MSSSDVSDVDCQDQALGFQFEPRKTLKSWSGSEWVYYETDEDVEEISSNLRTNLRILVHISYINFAPTILLKENLWTALVRMHDRKSSYLPPKDNVSNKAYRYAAYRQFTWWVHVHLGKSVRRVIPSCVVNKIQDTFLAPGNIYTLALKMGDCWTKMNCLGGHNVQKMAKVNE